MVSLQCVFLCSSTTTSSSVRESKNPAQWEEQKKRGKRHSKLLWRTEQRHLKFSRKRLHSRLYTLIRRMMKYREWNLMSKAFHNFFRYKKSQAFPFAFIAMLCFYYAHLRFTFEREASAVPASWLHFSWAISELRKESQFEICEHCRRTWRDDKSG